MAEEAAAKTGKGLSGFLSKDTAGLPNWAWLVVLGAGLAAAYVLPKFFGNSSQQPSSSTSGSDSSGIGLAVDPTTGLPYAVEGLVPSGGTTGGTTGPAGPQGPAGPPGPPGPTGETGPCPKLAPIACPRGAQPIYSIDANGCTTVKCGPPSPPVKVPPSSVNPGPVSTAKYVTVQEWPKPLSSLSDIASKNGLTLARLEQLNPQITNPNLIYAGQKIRIA